MITLTPSDTEALRDLFKFEPVSGKEIVAMTGLDPRQLLEAKIIRRLGRWDSGYYKDTEFPNEKGKM